MNEKEAIQRIKDRLRRRRIKIYQCNYYVGYIKIEWKWRRRYNYYYKYYSIIIKLGGEIKLLIDEDYKPFIKISGNYRTGRNFNKIIRLI